MPQDTIYISGETRPPPPTGPVYMSNGDTIYLPDSFYGTGGYRSWQILQQQELERQAAQKKSDSTGPIFFLLMIVVIFLIVGGDRISEMIGWTKKRRIKTALQTRDEKGIVYDNWLKKYNPYYNSLSSTYQQRFLQRTVEFMQAKEFKFHSMADEEYIPVLISGAAVQMTFGLVGYMMDYFPVIHVIRKEYVLTMDKETYYGHVSRSGIYISWNHFMEGYEDYTDAINVGLHEMAHAVSYDVFLGNEDAHDWNFKQRLGDFSEEGKPIFRAMRKGASHMLDDYATTNFDEFWAVCVETFFESPEAFKQTMPNLYDSLVELLNQDPLKPDKIINHTIAGLQMEE